MQPMVSKDFDLLCREAELASMSLCAGLTSLRKADPSRKGYYTQAFFSISIGLERLIKLIFIVDFAVTHGGKFPANKELRKLGHSILDSVKAIKGIANTYGHNKKWQGVVDDKICYEILLVLTEFAIGSRYSNLDALTNNERFNNPIAEWRLKVGGLILKKHPSRRRSNPMNAILDALMEESSMVMISGDDGNVIKDLRTLRSMHVDSERINKYGMRYLVRIIQMLSKLLSSIGDVANSQKKLCVPFFREFFVPFNGEKYYLVNKKSWSIYAPYIW